MKFTNRLFASGTSLALAAASLAIGLPSIALIALAFSAVVFAVPAASFIQTTPRSIFETRRMGLA